MRYVRMTMEDFAAYQRSAGLKVENIGSTWWTEIRPFFYRPLNPLAEFDTTDNPYPLKSRIGGCLHAVPSGAPSNARMNFYIYDDLPNYSLAVLNEKHRYITRKGLRNFEARQITDPDDFTESAHPVYVDFFHRTNYLYKKERLDKGCFREWARTLFANQELLVVGAYRQGRLAAVDISCQVEDMVVDDIFFADTESLDLKVTDFLLHTIREVAATSDAAIFFRGLPTGHRSLDESKLTRGCRILQKPARLRINPLALWGARLFMKDSYTKLLGITGGTTAEPNGTAPSSRSAELRASLAAGGR